MNSCISLFIFSTLFFIGSAKVHQAHLPEGWYSHEPKQLSDEIRGYLNLAKNHFPLNRDASPSTVRALIVPHAGHFYSGLGAAAAYQSIAGNSHTRVVIMAPSHVMHFNGIALPDYTEYRTPLGGIHVDTVACQQLAESNPDIFKEIPQAHVKEHAIEIQLPFLQETLTKFTLVPLVVGDIGSKEDFQKVARSLKSILNDGQTLLVVSSDFMHFGAQYGYQPFHRHKMSQIRKYDSLAVRAIQSLSYDAFDAALHKTKNTICGQNPIKIFLLWLTDFQSSKNEEDGNQVSSSLALYYTSAHMMRARGMRQEAGTIQVPYLLTNLEDEQVENSVSYVSMIFTNSAPTEEQPFSAFEKLSLLTLAREAIQNAYFSKNQQHSKADLQPMMSKALQKTNGAFVTLKTNAGELRGCIGHIVTEEPLYKTVHEMALAAAFQDHRFQPVQEKELPQLHLEISVLTSPKEIALYRNIKIGKHGIILKRRHSSAVFLPAVPVEQHWDLTMTLNQLSLKAGLGMKEWEKPDTKFQVFESIDIHEKDVARWREVQHEAYSPGRDEL